jgi:N-acetylmuramoyl-L-alanine amidase
MTNPKKAEPDKKSWFNLNPENKTLLIQIGGAIFMALVLILFFVPALSQNSRKFISGLTIVVAAGVIVWLIIRHFTPKSERDRAHHNLHHNFFFSNTRLLTVILTLAGLLGALFVYFQHQNLFQALGLVVSVIWVAVFLRYFMWSVYHYNINYGLTDEDWKKIEEARRLYKEGQPVNEEDLKAPDKNPYRSQTFGLPPGTVRGMIAFTLLLGGLSLLIVSFGHEYYTGDQMALIRQQFEFFETAFLMMIAFYFGDKSLKYLQNRWGEERTTPDTDTEEPKKQPPLKNEIDFDNWSLDMQNLVQDQESADTPPQSITETRKALSTQALSAPGERVLGGFVQLRDNLYSKVLSDEEIEKQITVLAESDGIELAMPVVKAVIEVESSGKGHLLNGKPKILFEGHRFWYWLQQKKRNEKYSEAEIEEYLKGLQAKFPGILYPRWTTKHYLWGEREYERLELARTIDSKSAIYSTSWGLFQMLGENLEHNLISRVNKNANADSEMYANAEDFEQKQSISEYYHFLDFLAFIKTKKVRGTRLIDFISEENRGNYDWDSFAYGYNGSGYKRNSYDLKLREAYFKYCKRYTVTHSEITSGYIPIIDAGHGGMTNGKYNTEGKQYKFTDGTKIFEGVINRQIGQQLIDMLEEADIPYHNLTVKEEEDISLEDRVTQANKLYTQNPNYYFLSIHSNAASNKISGEGERARGFEVWTSVGQTRSDDLATVAAKWYKHEFPEFRFRQDMTDGDEDREMEHERDTFYVLRKTKGPAFLVENLFYDNRLEAEFLLSAQGQRRIARCLFLIIQEIHQKFRV